VPDTTQEEANWWNGARHGRTRRYAESGRLISEQDFEYGVLVADREYDAGGEFVKDWRIGPDDDLFEVLRLSRERYGRPGGK